MVLFLQGIINISDINGLDISKSIYNMAIERKSIFDIDKDINEYIEKCNMEMANYTHKLVEFGIYRSADHIDNEIANGNLVLKANIMYINPEKCNAGYTNPFLVYHANNRKDYVNEYASCIKYVVENYNSIRRYEGFGLFQDYTSYLWYRYELSDYTDSNTYKIGDIVQLKKPINNYDKGIIVYTVSEPGISARTYHILCDNGFIMSTCENGELIHHNDIDKIIGQNINTAVDAIEQFPFFNNEYKEMVKHLVSKDK